MIKSKQCLFIYLISLMFILLAITSCNNNQPTQTDYYELTIEISGNGYVFLNDNEEMKVTEKKTIKVSKDITVILNPVSSKDYLFSKWQGPNSKDINHNNRILIDENKKLTAKFENINYSSASGEIEVHHNFPYSKLDKYETQNFNLDNNNLYSENDTTNYIVNFNRSITEQEINKLDKNYKIIDIIEPLSSVLIKSPDENIKHSIESLSFENDIKEIKKDQYMYLNNTNNFKNNYNHKQWNYPLIRLPQAWNSTEQNENIRIAILDSGVDINHPDLKNNIDIYNSYNFIDNNRNIQDNKGHGSHVAGIIGATTNNKMDIKGILDPVTILPLKVIKDNGKGSQFLISKAILYAAGILKSPHNPNPVDIINLSFSGTNLISELEDAIVKARNKGIKIIAASGNSIEDNNKVNYPAALSETIAVGSAAYNNRRPHRAIYSNYGESLDLLAPGGTNNYGIFSTLPENDYGYEFGTSMATPHVTGVVGLMLSNGIPPDNIRETLHQTAMPLGQKDFNIEYGHGLINAYWAVNNLYKDDLQILIGKRIDNKVDYVSKTSTSIKGGEYKLNNIPVGKHSIIAWIDVQNTGTIDPGDYYYETEPINFEFQNHKKIDLIIKETKGF